MPHKSCFAFCSSRFLSEDFLTASCLNHRLCPGLFYLALLGDVQHLLPESCCVALFMATIFFLRSKQY